nr:hypothetical protein [Flavobacterium azizsancarii]
MSKDFTVSLNNLVTSASFDTLACTAMAMLPLLIISFMDIFKKY